MQIASDVVTSLLSWRSKSNNNDSAETSTTSTFSNLVNGSHQKTEQSNKYSKNNSTMLSELDLTYITDNVIGMGPIVPSSMQLPPPPSNSSSSSKTRRSNDCDKLCAYINSAHRDKFLTINITDNVLDPISMSSMHSQVLDFHWESPGSKSQTPSLSHISKICYAIHAYLSLSSDNVVGIFCSNGKTRTGIVVACYLKFAGLVDSSFDGFSVFCRKRCMPHGHSSSTSKRSPPIIDNIAEQIPPSLRSFFRNFDDCVELGGFPQPQQLLLCAVKVDGVPVDDMPIIDIWDCNQQIYCSSEVDDSNLEWSEETGFYKVNKKILGDFVVLCRFGGQFKNDRDDSSKVLFRYANSTGFLCHGAYELTKQKIDMMKRYSDSFDDEEFQVTLMFSSPNDNSPGSGGNSPTLPRVYDGEDSIEEGWKALSSVHTVAPLPEATAMIVSEGYPMEVATLSLQFTNNDVQRAIEELETNLLHLCEKFGFNLEENRRRRRERTGSDTNIHGRKNIENEEEHDEEDEMVMVEDIDDDDGELVSPQNVDSAKRLQETIRSLDFGFGIESKRPSPKSLTNFSGARAKVASSLVLHPPAPPPQTAFNYVAQQPTKSII